MDRVIAVPHPTHLSDISWELLADGEATLYDFVQQREVGDDADPSQLGLALSKQSILYWVAAFRLVLQLH